MICEQCNAVDVPERAAFCPSCGARIKKPAEKPAERGQPTDRPADPPRSTTNLNVTQNLTDASDTNAVGVEIKELRGDARIEGGQVVVKMSEGSDLKLIESISTEVRLGAAAGIEGSKIPQRFDETHRRLDALIELVKAKDRVGREVAAVSDSTTHISRVNLLLKKATLLKIQAEQMMLDHATRNRRRVNLATGRIDLNDLMRDFDQAAHDAKLREAHGLLVEARKLDPTDTEVLLHLAELLTHVTENDPSDERRVLYEVQGLLRNPKNDTERFRLAQSTFLLATSNEPIDDRSLRDARDMFERLGRTEWVRHCDDLLKSGSQGGAAPAYERRDTRGSGTGHASTGSGYAGTGHGYGEGFSPTGRWDVRVMDAMGSTMTLEFRQDGTFFATQQAGYGAISLQANGQWVFNPMNRWLQLQGLIAGFQPFMLGIAIQGQQGNGFYAVGTDGIAYVLTRAET